MTFQIHPQITQIPQNEFAGTGKQPGRQDLLCINHLRNLWISGI